MPKIRTATLNDHHDAVWAAIVKALERLLAEKTYDELSVGEIAAAAGMARNTLYNYAPDKATLVAKAAEISNQDFYESIRELADGHDAPPRKLARIMAAVIGWYGATEHRPLLVQTLFRPVPDEVHKRAGAPMVRASRFVVRVVEEGLASGDFRGADNAEMMEDFLAGAITRAAMRVVEAPEQAATISAEMQAFALRALGCATPLSLVQQDNP
ncbi:TetR/AcrR family transcriptional regulator [Novosphingobium bradum]|uniref:TetR/AcrR family transcriptional regulator n=1 Tax=Novosphingobium bradum TaxID=1737444 RepID=A0ABV7ISN0_9SPHN